VRKHDYWHDFITDSEQEFFQQTQICFDKLKEKVLGKRSDLKSFVLYKPVKPTSITAFVDTLLIAKNLIADEKEVFFLNFQVENKEKPDWFDVNLHGGSETEII